VPKDIGQKYIDQNPAVPLDFGYTVETKDTPSAFAVRKDNKDLLTKLNAGWRRPSPTGPSRASTRSSTRASRCRRNLSRADPNFLCRTCGRNVPQFAAHRIQNRKGNPMRKTALVAVAAALLAGSRRVGVGVLTLLCASARSATPNRTPTR
jgi:hypothetical protein